MLFYFIFDHMCCLEHANHDLFLAIQFINLHVLTHIADADAMATAELWE